MIDPTFEADIESNFSDSMASREIEELSAIICGDGDRRIDSEQDDDVGEEDVDEEEVVEEGMGEEIEEETVEEEEEVGDTVETAVEKELTSTGEVDAKLSVESRLATASFVDCRNHGADEDSFLRGGERAEEEEDEEVVVTDVEEEEEDEEGGSDAGISDEVEGPVKVVGAGLNAAKDVDGVVTSPQLQDTFSAPGNVALITGETAIVSPTNPAFANNFESSVVAATSKPRQDLEEFANTSEELSKQLMEEIIKLDS